MDREQVMMWIAIGTFVILVLRTISGQIIAPLTQQISILAENVRSLKEIIDEVRADLVNVRERITSTEAITKSLHKRVDRIEAKLETKVDRD